MTTSNVYFSDNSELPPCQQSKQGKIIRKCSELFMLPLQMIGQGSTCNRNQGITSTHDMQRFKEEQA